jgi:hypothetical protein
MHVREVRQPPLTPGSVTHPCTSRIYEVRAEYAKGSRVRAFGACRTRPEAEVLLAESTRRADAAGIKYERYWIEEIDTTGLWQPPAQPKPRDRYSTRVTTTSARGTWKQVHVDVLDGETVIASYDRNYSMLQTFEPFRQGDRVFALISTHYTATSVIDLHTGQIVAAEEPAGGGFCPVGFYVPDWWDLHDGTKLPGSMHWRPADDEWAGRRFRVRLGLHLGRRLLMESAVPRPLASHRWRDPPRRPVRLPQARHRSQARAARLHPLLLLARRTARRVLH